MNRRYSVIISIILIVIVIVGLVIYFDYSSIRTKSASEPPAGAPPLLYSNNFPQPINASQGTTQQVNLTFTSYQSPEIAIPIENIMIAGYTSAIYIRALMGLLLGAHLLKKQFSTTHLALVNSFCNQICLTRLL
jgi:hypothetical protein